MKKKIFFVFSFTALLNLLWSQVPYLDWGKTIATQNLLPGFYWPQNKAPIGSGTDVIGNIYVGGHISGETFDMDPSPSVTNLTAVNDSLDIFIAKYNSNGTLGWTFRIASVNIDNLSDLKTDLAGNVYIMGAISSSADFDPSAGTAILNPAGKAGFVAKYNSSGVYQWAFLIPNSITNSPLTDFNYTPITTALCVGNSGNVYITGVVSSGIFDFDPSAAVAGVDAWTSTTQQTFIAAYTGNGNFLWVTAFGAAIAHRDLSVDAAGQLVFTGGFANTGEFNPNGSSVLLNAGSPNTGDGFIAKYNASTCVLQWIKQVQASDAAFYKHSISQNGNIQLFGLFKGNIDLDPGAGNYVLVEPNFGSFVVASYDSTGNFNWGFKYDTTLFVEDIAYEPQSGDLLLCGYIFHATDFDAAAGTAVLDTVMDVNGYIHQGYLARYSSGGAFKNAFMNNTFNFDVDCGINGEIYSLGILQGIVDIDLSPAVSWLNSASPMPGWYTSDYNICKYSVFPVSVQEFGKDILFSAYPNPAKDAITLNAGFNLENYSIISSDGRIVKQGKIQGQSTTISLKELEEGVYFINLNQGKAVKKILLCH